MEERGGTLRRSSYADVRSLDDVLAIEGSLVAYDQDCDGRCYREPRACHQVQRNRVRPKSVLRRAVVLAVPSISPSARNENPNSLVLVLVLVQFTFVCFLAVFCVCPLVLPSFSAPAEKVRPPCS